MHHYHALSLRSFEGVTPTLGRGVLVDPSSVIIGDVHIGQDSSVWPQVSIRGDMHRIRIGARTSIQDGCVLHITHAGPYNEAGWPLHIGDEVTVGHSVTLHGCHIGNRVLVGMGATVMDGAVVEDDVVIGAHCLVPPGKHLAGGYLYTGTPARQSRALNEQEMAYFSYAANNYVALKDRHIAALEAAAPAQDPR